MMETAAARLFNNADWATKTVTSSSSSTATHNNISSALHLLTPLVKLGTALVVSYMAAGLRSKPRLSSAFVSATVCSFLTYAFLEPMMVHHRSGSSDGGRDVELSHVALVVLSVYAALLGGALGSLLPRPMGGMTLGCGVGIGIVTLLPKSSTTNGVVVLGEFMVWGSALALIGGVLATR